MERWWHRDLQKMAAHIKGDLTDPRRARHNLAATPAGKIDQFGPWWQLSSYGMGLVRATARRVCVCML